MENIIYKIENIVWGLPLVIILIVTHVFFTVYLKFPQKNIFKGISYIIKSKNNKGINSFKSVMTILASTIGIGNILGISTAICIGGIGSVFWVFVSGILAISSKYAETYIPLKYRKKYNNKYKGGTMYLLESIGYNRLALLFSILLIIISFGGIMIQSNTIVNYAINIIDIDKVILTIIIVITSIYILFGNVKRIADINAILIPIAVISYILLCVLVIIKFRYNLINTLLNIIYSAFSIKSSFGGIVGVSVIRIVTVGLSKGLFSNESGMGTSPLFNINVEGKNNIEKESIIASTSVFIDTVIVCTLTGITIAISNNSITDPINLIINTFNTIFLGEYILLICLIIFGLTSIPCLGYYGKKGIEYCFKDKIIYVYIYKLTYIIIVIIGCFFKTEVIWSIATICNGVIIIPNLIMLYNFKKDLK